MKCPRDSKKKSDWFRCEKISQKLRYLNFKCEQSERYFFVVFCSFHHSAHVPYKKCHWGTSEKREWKSGFILQKCVHHKNLWLEQKWVNRDYFSIGGKLRLHNLWQNKHFSTTRTISPNYIKKHNLAPLVSFFWTIYLLIKISFSFSYLEGFPICRVILLFSLYPAPWLDDLSIANLKTTPNFYGIICFQFWSWCSDMKSASRC